MFSWDPDNLDTDKPLKYQSIKFIKSDSNNRIPELRGYMNYQNCAIIYIFDSDLVWQMQ